MSYSLNATKKFKKELKYLAKKYVSLKDEYAQLLDNLEDNPEQGIPLGRNCYKIRLAIKSKNKGKSGGARIITFVYVENEELYLLSIFDKSDKESISDKELEELLSSAGLL